MSYSADRLPHCHKIIPMCVSACMSRAKSAIHAAHVAPRQKVVEQTWHRRIDNVDIVVEARRKAHQHADSDDKRGIGRVDAHCVPAATKVVEVLVGNRCCGLPVHRCSRRHP
eukprot:365377-Chlamydomonas_euryale.AAC.49